MSPARAYRDRLASNYPPDIPHENLRPVNGREQTPTSPRRVPAISGRQLRSLYISEFPTTKSFATENSKLPRGCSLMFCARKRCVELDRVRHSDQPALPRLVRCRQHLWVCFRLPQLCLFRAIAPQGRKFGSRTGEVLFFELTRAGLPLPTNKRPPRSPPAAYYQPTAYARQPGCDPKCQTKSGSKPRTPDRRPARAGRSRTISIPYLARAGLPQLPPLAHRQLTSSLTLDPSGPPARTSRSTGSLPKRDIVVSAVGERVVGSMSVIVIRWPCLLELLCRACHTKNHELDFEEKPYWRAARSLAFDVSSKGARTGRGIEGRVSGLNRTSEIKTIRCDTPSGFSRMPGSARGRRTICLSTIVRINYA